jgi:hypothetical protein
MPAVRRAVSMVVLAWALGACTAAGDPGEPSGPPSPSSEPSVTASATPTGTPEPTGPTATAPTGPTAPLELDLPADAPTLVDDPRAVTEITAGGFEALAPPHARIRAADVQTDPFGQIGLVWDRGNDPFQAERGFVLWRATDDPGWRAIYAFTDERRSGVLGITQDGRDDLTGDGLDELLTFESTGGSGACGISRVISPTGVAATEIFKRSACDAQASLEGGHLVLREAVFGPDDPHCCPSAFRTTTYDWNGDRLVPGDVEEAAAR